MGFLQKLDSAIEEMGIPKAPHQGIGSMPAQYRDTLAMTTSLTKHIHVLGLYRQEAIYNISARVKSLAGILKREIYALMILMYVSQNKICSVKLNTWAHQIPNASGLR